MTLRLWRTAAIVLAGVLLGLAWNGISGRGLALGKNALVKEGDELVEPAAGRARLDKGALFLDARPFDYYKMGHVPGALSLPEDEFEAAFTRLEPTLRSQLDVIVYCSYGCEASHIVSRRLKEKGVPAAILHDGWESWTDAHLPTREGAEP